MNLPEDKLILSLVRQSLKEQKAGSPFVGTRHQYDQTQKTTSFNDKYVLVPIPENQFTKSPTIALPKNAHYVLFEHPIDPMKFNPEFQQWIGTGWEKWIPSQTELEKVFKEGDLRAFRLEDNSFYQASIKFIPEPTKDNTFYFNWFLNEQNEPFQPQLTGEEIPDKMKMNDDESFWGHWGMIISQVGITLAAAWLSGGLSIWIQLAIQAGIDLSFAGVQYFEGDNFGAAISALLAFIPFSSKFLKIGEVSEKILGSIIQKVSHCTNINELKTIFEGFSGEEKVAFKKIFANQKNVLLKATNKSFYTQIKTAVENGTLKLSKIPVAQRQHVRDFIFQLVLSAGIVGAAAKIETDRLMKQMQNDEAQIIQQIKNNIDFGTEDDFQKFKQDYLKSHH